MIPCLSFTSPGGGLTAIRRLNSRIPDNSLDAPLSWTGTPYVGRPASLAEAMLESLQVCGSILEYPGYQAGDQMSGCAGQISIRKFGGRPSG